LTSRLTSADSGLQLDLEMALGGIPTKDQPHGLLQIQLGITALGRRDFFWISSASIATRLIQIALPRLI